TTYSGAVGEGPTPTITSVSFSGQGSALTVSIHGRGLGTAPPTPSPSSPVSCVSGDTSYVYPAGVLSFYDNTQGWGAGEDGDCLGLSVTGWSAQVATFTFGAYYPNLPPVTSGDSFQLQ